MRPHVLEKKKKKEARKKSDRLAKFDDTEKANIAGVIIAGMFCLIAALFAKTAMEPGKAVIIAAVGCGALTVAGVMCLGRAFRKKS